MNYRLKWAASALALGVPLLAAAQPGHKDPTRPDTASALRYESAFANYKPWQDTKRADWRAVNDAVRDAAGTGGHAEQPKSAPPAMASAPASAASAPGGAGHDNSGHRMPAGKP